MAPLPGDHFHLLSRDSYDGYGYGTISSSTYTIIIVVVVVLFVIKIALLFYILSLRRRKRRERAEKGCTCFTDGDYFCTPVCCWADDSKCHCGALTGDRPANRQPQVATYGRDESPKHNNTTGSNVELGPVANPPLPLLDEHQERLETRVETQPREIPRSSTPIRYA